MSEIFENFRWFLSVSDCIMADSMDSSDSDSGAFDDQSCENHSFEKLFGESKTGFYTVFIQSIRFVQSYAGQMQPLHSF